MLGRHCCFTMLLFVCCCFKDFVVVFVEAWLSLLFRDAVVCLLLF